MTADILDGRLLASRLREQLAEQVAAFRRHTGYGPQLTVVRVGNDPVSLIYAREIDKAFRDTGFGYQLEVLHPNATQSELVGQLHRLGRDAQANGIMLQRPLPAHIKSETVIEHLTVEKDVEGVTPHNLGKLMANAGEYFPTSTPSAALCLLHDAGIQIEGKHAVVVGRSNILGRPLSLMLLRENATVTTCHSRTPFLGSFTRQADILIAAAGKRKLITAEMVKPGATVIDFGVNYADGGRTCGDVAFDQVREVAGAITPVPGGTGPITTVILMTNTLEAAKRQMKMAKVVG